MSELLEFHRELIADIQNEADAEGLFTVEAFFEKMADLLTEAGELEGGDRCFYEGRAGSAMMQVDGYGGDPREAEGVLSLIICDFAVTDEPRSFKAADIKTRFGRLLTFLRQSRKAEFREGLEETGAGFGLADLIATTWKQVTKIKLILITNADNRSKVDGVKAGTLDDKTVTYNVWDLKRIRAFMESGQAREDLFVDFAGEFGGPVPVLPAFGADTALESFVAVIPGEQLAAIYEKWGARLLEANVRSFLQARNKVNRGIRDTIKTEPDMFFSYNNGITATAEGVVIEKSTDGPLLYCAENLQIVNGGQTTASVHAALKLSPEQLKNVRVQMKLSVVPPKRAEEVVPKISEYANSQNKVNAADFFANHPFHVRVEEFSRRVLAPVGEGAYKESKWFYERARGQYHDERGRRTVSERKKFDLQFPRKQFLTKTDLAKFENSWAGKPEDVSKGAQKNFAIFAKDIGKLWKKAETTFEETWYKRMVAKAIIFRTLEKLIPKQDWYEGDYRAQVVTYTMAKIAWDAEEMKQVVDLDAVWKAQQVGESLERSLLVAAEAAHHVITSPPTGVKNMSEWAKKQACWAQLQRMEIEYGPWIMKCLIDPAEAAAVVKAARREVSLDNGIDAQKEVFDLGADYWRDALSWGRAKRLLAPREAGVLALCAGMPMKLPSEKQCIVAMAALHKILDAGYSAAEAAAE